MIKEGREGSYRERGMGGQKEGNEEGMNGKRRERGRGEREGIKLFMLVEDESKN